MVNSSRELLQKYPMCCVDAFVINSDKYYYGIKNIQANEKSIFLLLEGMGQTVEYNIRKKMGVGNDKLLLASIKEVLIDSECDVIDRLIFCVIHIEQQYGFFVSEVEARVKEKENTKVIYAKMVHKLR